MYLAKTPRIIQKLFPNLQWQGDNQRKVLYLTFDDGPIPEATPWILDVLDELDIKATFFCVGQNVEKHLEIYKRIQHSGHSIGNHSYSHISGWSTNHDDYLKNIELATSSIKSSLYRPPYGRMTLKQIRSISTHFQIVMWDVLSGDFDPNISAHSCRQNVYSNVEAGSIIVFHDSIKSVDKLKLFLPDLLQQLIEDGYKFNILKSLQ